MPWRDAIITVLSESEDAMHYSEIAQKIVEDNLRSKVGATPAATVNANITTSLKDEGAESPFIRVGRGEYFLKEKHEPDAVKTHSSTLTPIASPEEEQESAIVHAFGMFWQRELVLWSSNPGILGRQQLGADPVNFAEQLGVYLLHDGREVVYVGRSVDRPLGRRLYEHTQDRLRGRWNRFSWFGLLNVKEDGSLENTIAKPSFQTIITTLEALLIEGLEPPQNRKRGDDFNAIEYLQAEDPEIEKQQMRAVIADMQKKLV